jgi:hypothetical protein
MSKTKRASVAQEFCHCVAGTKTHLPKGRMADRDAQDIAAISFWLTVHTSSIVYPGVRSHMRCTKRASFAQDFCHGVGTTKKLPSGNAVIGRPHDALVTYGHFLLAGSIGFI